jgi:hypothetical protein
MQAPAVASDVLGSHGSLRLGRGKDDDDIALFAFAPDARGGRSGLSLSMGRGIVGEKAPLRLRNPNKALAAKACTDCPMGHARQED